MKLLNKIIKYFKPPLLGTPSVNNPLSQTKNRVLATVYLLYYSSLATLHFTFVSMCRQSLIFSSYPCPEVNAIFNMSNCTNYFGRVRVANPTIGGGICQVNKQAGSRLTQP